MLRVISSNRLEVLADAFVDDFVARGRTGASADPLSPLHVVVPSMGTGQWLKHAMARRLGIAAQLDVSLPSAFAWRVFRAFDPALPEESDFALERMRWRLYRLLPTLDDAVFAPLRGYLQDDDAARADRKRYQLATRLATLYDQYLVYRRDWIAAFEGAPPRFPSDAELLAREPWQASLWQRLVADVGHARHRAAVLQGVLDTLRTLGARADAGAGARLPAELPMQVTVFGVPALAPDAALLFGALAMHIDVHVLLPNACRDYWGDIVSPRSLALRREGAPGRVASGARHDDEAAEHLLVGHPLLASCGRMNRDGVDLVNELVEALGEDAMDGEAFVDPDERTLLGRLQADMLSLRTPGVGGRQEVGGDDTSLRIRACHSPLREVEVLHDVLLEAFAADATLEPRHVLVMVPDLERYAPLLDAVFGSAPPARHLRFAIADRVDEGAAPIVAALQQLMRLDASRWTAGEVLALLDIPAIRARFDLDDERLQQARHWLREAGVRWGRDGADWARRDLPVEAQRQPNTWAFGLERLLLGHALPDGAAPFDDLAPVPGVEGGGARVLDGVLRLLDVLGEIERDLHAPVPADAWVQRVEHWIDALFAPAREDAEAFLALGRLRELLRRLASETARAGVDEPLPAAVLREYFDDGLSLPAETPRYLTGAVTVCTLLPMRTIPFRHVYLVGMNEADFPRQHVPPGFDLMARARRKGDRVRRDEDRQLFLDAVLSARERLHLSYVGQSDRDGDRRESSVLVSELIETLEAGYAAPSGAPLRDWLCDAYPLQPFARAYDTGARRTYEDLWSGPALPSDLAWSGGVAPAVVLPRDHASTLVVSPDRLQQFLRRPAAWFLREALDARVPDDADAVDDDEPFTLDALEVHALRTDGLRALRAGQFERWLADVRLRGALPHGIAGAALLARWRDELVALGAEAGEAFTMPALPVHIDLHLGALHLGDLHLGGPRFGDLHVLGPLRRVSPAGYLHVRVGSASGRDEADAYVAQLLLCATGGPTESRIVAEKKRLTLSAIDAADARDALAGLGALYRRALAAPLPLFVDTSQAWVRTRDAARAMQAWGTDVEPDDRFGARPERLDTDVRLLWGERTTPPEGWQACAEAAYARLERVIPDGKARAAPAGGDDA